MSNVHFWFQTSAVESTEKPEVQDLLDSVDGHIRCATLGYGLMTVMDENDLGRGPIIERQIINLRNIDDDFMDMLVSGVHEHGLQNWVVENAIVIGIHRSDIDLCSLEPMKAGLYTNRVKWSMHESHSRSTSILYNGNHRFNYMRYHSDVRKTYTQHTKAKEELAKASTGAMIQGLKQVIADAETIIMKDGIWLVRFVDLGEWGVAWAQSGARLCQWYNSMLMDIW